MPALLASAEYITATWRRLVQPRCTAAALERYDMVVAYFFSESRLRLVLDDMRCAMMPPKTPAPATALTPL